MQLATKPAQNMTIAKQITATAFGVHLQVDKTMT